MTARTKSRAPTPASTKCGLTSRRPASSIGTVAALGEKVIVKRRAEQKVAETKAVVRHQGQEFGARARAHPAIPLGAVAAVAAVVIPRRRRTVQGRPE
ncbi:MAG: hypothetical protein QOH91_2870 [Mycobacterium sp.]|nr:hypothetical protein [Mycobacterium sp.]